MRATSSFAIMLVVAAAISAPMIVMAEPAGIDSPLAIVATTDTTHAARATADERVRAALFAGVVVDDEADLKTGGDVQIAPRHAAVARVEFR